MKSAPEIWQLVDDEGLARSWLEALTGLEGEVRAVGRRPERTLVWRASDGAALEFVLEERGFGTQVSITSDSCGGELLERVMEQLAEPERRPFTRN